MEGSTLDLIQIGSAIYQNYLGTEGQSHSSLAAVMDTTSHGIPESERDIRRNKWLENRERASHEEPGNKVKGLLLNFARWFKFSRNRSQGNTDLEAARRGTTGAGSVTAGNNDLELGRGLTTSVVNGFWSGRVPENNDNARPLLDVSPLSPEDRDFEKKMADLYGFLCQRKSDIMSGYRGNLLVLVGFTGFLHSVPLNCRIVPLFAILAGLSGLAAVFLGVLSWFEMCDVHQGLIDAIQESGQSMSVPSSKKKLLLRNDSKFKTCTIEIAILSLFSLFFAGLVFLFVGTGCR